jgi:hypothetical protein
MRLSRLFAFGFAMAFLPGCAGCGHDEVVVKDQRPEPASTSTVTVVEPAAPAPTVTPAPATTVNVTH